MKEKHRQTMKALFVSMSLSSCSERRGAAVTGCVVAGTDRNDPFNGGGRSVVLRPAGHHPAMRRSLVPRQNEAENFRYKPLLVGVQEINATPQNTPGKSRAQPFPLRVSPYPKHGSACVAAAPASFLPSSHPRLL